MQRGDQVMYIEFLLEKYVDQVYNGKMTKDEFFTKVEKIVANFNGELEQMEKAHQSEMHN
tara:strand:+ start:5151 stop:5330 length:180 start_codon:yes stop_codon:yes gene_type:complete